KGEQLNPGGSGKDRVALALIERAERNGLAPGGTVVEATSGNTGISLAMISAVRGYRLRVVASTKVAAEKLRILRAFGAEVHLTPDVPHGSPEHYTRVAQRIAAETPNAFFLDQFHAPENTAIHEAETGPELLAQVKSVAGKLDAFVCGAGTGGTFVGIARFLRRAAPGARIALADPEGSVLGGAESFRPYLMEGIGDDTLPPLFDRTLVDDCIGVSDSESFRVALQAARLEGLLVGGSSGCHLAASARLARKLPPGSVVTTILPDTGRNYLSKFLDPEWCTQRGLGGLHQEANA
ncbi:MAG TPA: cysteine synthase family protein, partial [Thermoplasmata archaeon]|nr:cysteine synthase family protein [Thermoplasmata archaeon]